MPLPKPNPGDSLRAAEMRDVSLYAEASKPISGKGISVRRTPRGSVISLSPIQRAFPASGSDGTLEGDIDNMLFDLRWSAGLIYAWFDSNYHEAVRRNGFTAIENAGIIVTVPDWYLIYDVTGLEGWEASTWYVYVVYVQESTAASPFWPTGHNSTCGWEIMVSDAPADFDAKDTRQKTPVLIGLIKGGVVEQYHHGGINTFYAMPDSEQDGGNSSLEYLSDGQFELYNFGGESSVFDIENADVVFRRQLEGRNYIDYMTLSSLITIMQSETDNPDPYGLTSDTNNDTDPDVILVFDPNTDAFEKRKFWISGDGTDTCFGSIIGDSTQAEKINLDSCMLTAPGEDTLDWVNKILDYGWQAKDASQVLAANFAGRVLLDYLGAESINWSGRTLSGSWGVATGGSFNTPSLLVGNVQYAPETIAVVTGVTVDPVTHVATLTTADKTVLVAQP